jgi:hypothetical protein
MPRNKSNLLSRSKPFEWFAVLSVYFVAVASPSWLLLKSSTRTTLQQIKPIERIHENELDPAAFLAKYVATETPVIIVRDDTRYKGAADGFMLSFINNCSDLSVPGIPYAAMKAITSLSPWQHRLASFILNLLVGIDLKTFMKNRKNISVADKYTPSRQKSDITDDGPVQVSNVFATKYTADLRDLYSTTVSCGCTIVLQHRKG